MNLPEASSDTPDNPLLAEGAALYPMKVEGQGAVNDGTSIVYRNRKLHPVSSKSCFYCTCSAVSAYMPGHDIVLLPT